jgi:hypothetical protein
VTPSGVSNPYLSDVLTNISVSPPAREVPLSAAIPVQPPPNAAPATLFPATPSPLEPKATEAEKLKQTDDGKYFRQLKRF